VMTLPEEFGRYFRGEAESGRFWPVPVVQKTGSSPFRGGSSRPDPLTCPSGFHSCLWACPPAARRTIYCL